LPDPAELPAPREVRRFVDAKGSDAANVARPAAGGIDNSQDVPERLRELRNKLLALERLVSVPAHLPGEIKDSTASGDDAVGVSDGPLPSGGQDHLRRHRDVSLALMARAVRNPGAQHRSRIKS